MEKRFAALWPSCGFLMMAVTAKGKVARAGKTPCRDGQPVASSRTLLLINEHPVCAQFTTQHRMQDTKVVKVQYYIISILKKSQSRIAMRAGKRGDEQGGKCSDRGTVKAAPKMCMCYICGREYGSLR